MGQQHRSFAMHLGLVLQVLHRFDTLGQGCFQTGQGLTRQRCACFGSVTLPSQGIGHGHVGGIAQGLAFGRPLLHQSVLVLAFAQLVQALAQQFGRAFVAMTHFVVGGLQFVEGRLFGQPVAQQIHALTGLGGTEGTPAQSVKGSKVKRGMGRISHGSGSHRN